MGTAIDITGHRYGNLVALKITTKDKFGHLIWTCKCDCGNIKSASADNLRRGLIVSCGCFRTKCLEDRATHGQDRVNNRTTEYGTWASMKARCYNLKNKKYKDYGGRGIVVCDRWLNSFGNFFEDMGKKPTLYHTLDRIENDGNYEPLNCRWATDHQQSRNRRSNCWIEHDNKRMVTIDCAMYFRVSYNQLRLQLKTKSFSQIYEYYKAKSVA